MFPKLINRKCLHDDCPQSKKFTLCFRDQMYFHIAKIPVQKMLEIVLKYNLVRFPFVLSNRTLANLITDCTVESVWNEIEKGGKS